jgi:hypothetical protein
LNWWRVSASSQRPPQRALSPLRVATRSHRQGYSCEKRFIPPVRGRPGLQKSNSLLVHRDTIYLVGGYAESGALGDTQYAAIDEDGLLHTWKMSQNKLNFPRSNHALEVVTTIDGDVYLLAIVGGVDTIDGDTVHYDYVEAAQILDDGSTGPWKTCLYHLKGGRSAPATFVHNGRLYVLGGWGDLLTKDVFQDVQYASIRSDGCVDYWHTNPYGLASRLYGHTVELTTATGRPIAVVMGGNLGQGIYQNALFYAEIAPDGSVGFMEPQPSLFSIPRWGHQSVVYNNSIYVMGGSSRGEPAFLNDVQFAPLSAGDR